MARDELLEKGWRRHSVVALSGKIIELLTSELPQKIIDVASIEGAVILIALYDCGVVADSFDDEPWAQLLVAKPTKFNKQLSKGRNPRRLHFYVSKGGQEQAFETNALGICQIDREVLLKLEVSRTYSVSEANKFDLKQWLAERYRQDTWPDAFNNAVRPRTDKLKKLWKRYNHFISGLYVKLNSYEELIEGKYSVAVIIVIVDGMERALIKKMRENNQQLKDKAIDDVKNHLANEVLMAFDDSVIFLNDPTNKAHGKAVEVFAESQVTMHHQRTFGRFSPYSLSEYGTEAPMPPEMTSGRVH